MQRRPRILILITLAETGGAQTYVMSLLPALTERFDVTVAAWGPGPLADAARRAGATYVPLRWVRRAVHPVRDVLGLFELVRLCRRVRPDVVHANSSKAGVLGRLAARLAGVRATVFTVHGWAFKQYSGVASRLYLWADRAMRPLTTQIVCVAENERRAGIAARTCDADRTIVIPNAVDTSAAPRSPLAGEPPHVVSVGRLKEPKDFVTLMDALTRVERPYRASIAGDGPDRQAVEEHAPEAVTLLGDHDDVPGLLADGDVFVLSSRSEGMPMSILEAMAAGLPVVASRVGGVPELVVDGETGILVDPGDAGALARALERLLGDPGLRQRLGSAGRERVDREFDVAAFRNAHVRLYESLLP